MTVADTIDPTDPGPGGRRARPAQIAPHDLDAEAALLAAAMLDPEAVVPLIDALPADALYHPGHTAIALAILGLVGDGIRPDPVTVGARLRQGGDHHIANHLLIDVVAHAAIPSAAPGYAEIVRDHQRRRATLALARDLGLAAQQGHHHTVAQLLDRARTEHADPAIQDRLLPGGDWIIDAPPGIPAVWGDGDDVLWAEGESLIIAGPPGVGKTTVTGQVVFARLGLLGDVLGYPVTPTRRRVLYLAMDRPRQIQRALARLVHPDHRATLNDRLVVRPGPPPRDLAKHWEALGAIARQADADTVVIDSLKDAAIGLADDEVGAALNRAMQSALADGIEVLALHHQRKAQNGHKPRSLEDLYGSTWIAAGAGSVVLLWGSAGDAIVELVHLKQPGAPVGPLKVEHDALAGTSAVVQGFDLLAYLRRQPRPVTTETVAHASLGRAANDNETRTVRRRLCSLDDRGLVVRTEEPNPGGGHPTALWAAVDDRHGEPA